MAETVKRELPPLPNLEWLKKEAKARLDDMRAQMPSARLADAQFLLAREYGFANWATLKAEVEQRAAGLDATEMRALRARGALHRAQIRSAATEDDVDAQSPVPFLRLGFTMVVGFLLVAIVGLAIVIAGSESGPERFLALMRALYGGGR